MKCFSGKKHGKTRKVLKALLIATAVFTMVSVSFSAIFFTAFFGRNDEPEPAELTYYDLGAGAPQRTDVEFYSGTNKLKGYLYLPKSEMKGIILIVAGISSGADSHLAETICFLDEGFGVFTFDGTGTRQSEGRGVIGLSQAKLDAACAINAVRENPASAGFPILLYGHSVGGYACAASLPEESVAGAVSIGGFNSPVETMLFYGRQKAWILADIEYPFLLLQNYFLFGSEGDVSAVNQVNKTDKPILFVEGNEDLIIPGEISVSHHADQLRNPNARFVEITEPYRNGHSTAWLSADAAKYRRESSASEQNIDKQRANELDTEFMKLIIDFYNEALSLQNSSKTE